MIAAETAIPTIAPQTVITGAKEPNSKAPIPALAEAALSVTVLSIKPNQTGGLLCS